MPDRKIVCLFSGGLDSSTLLFWEQSQGHDVHALVIDYGQRHRREYQAAAQIIEKMGLSFDHLKIICLDNLKDLLQGSALIDQSIPVPEGHYAAETMRTTIVPNRNMILLSLAAAYAISLGARDVAYAAHAGDHAIYADCRPAFTGAMRYALQTCHSESVLLHTPFLLNTKANIVTLGAALGVPFDLTYSCYKGRECHCGKCGTCTERKEAFKIAGIADPTVYES